MYCIPSKARNSEAEVQDNDSSEGRAWHKLRGEDNSKERTNERRTNE